MIYRTYNSIAPVVKTRTLSYLGWLMHCSERLAIVLYGIFLIVGMQGRMLNCKYNSAKKFKVMRCCDRPLDAVRQTTSNLSEPSCA